MTDMTFQVNWPGRIVFGAGKLAVLGEEAKALGGGSAIDFAKALAAAVTHEGPIWDYVTYTGANAKPLGASMLPLVAIPTTGLIRRTVGPKMGIKASGRVGNFFRYVSMLEAGATRVGLVLEQAREILRGCEDQKGKR